MARRACLRPRGTVLGADSYHAVTITLGTLGVMPEVVDYPRPWRHLPVSLAPALRARMPELVAAVARQAVQVIAGDHADAKLERDVHRGVSVALERLVDLIGTDAPALAPGVRETFVDLGAAEAREDRPPEILLTAVRTAGRVAIRIGAEGLAQTLPGGEPVPAAALLDLSDAITAFTDQLVTATSEGYALQLRELAGERDRRRRLLAELLVRGSAPERAVVAAAAAAGWHRIDEVVAVLLPADQSRQVQFRFRDDAVVLERERDAVLLVRQGRSASRAHLTRALAGRGAVVGVRVDWARVPQSVRLAELTGTLTGTFAGEPADGSVARPGGGDPVFAADHLVALALRGEQAAYTLLAERRLAPFDAVPEPTRARLLETLAGWLRHWGSRSAVADELRIHPQTVSYRVRRLRELLGDDLDDADARFELALVLAGRPAPAPADARPGA